MAYSNLHLRLAINRDGSITATWDPLTGDVYYDFKMYTTGKDYMWCSEKHMRTTSYTSQAGLKEGLQFHAVASAYTASGSSLDSELAIMNFPNGFYANIPLLAPLKLEATAQASSVTLTWDKVDRAAAYDIIFDGMVYDFSRDYSDRRTWQCKDLQPKTSYTYAVRAKNSFQTGPYSALKTVTTLPYFLPPPSAVIPTATENTVTVSWRPVQGATGYDLLFQGNVYHVNDTTKTFTGLQPNTKYTCSVRCYNAEGAGNYSGERYVVTTPLAPAEPQVSVEENTITITWGGTAGATGYEVLFNGKIYEVSTPTITIPGLQPGEDYSFAIRTKNADGTSSFGKTQEVKTKPGEPAPRVTTTDKTASIKWDPIQGAIGYQVAFNHMLYDVKDPYMYFSTLYPNTEYSCTVRAKSKDGYGEYSKAKTFKTAPKAPSAPKVTTGEDSLTFTWEPVEGALSYDLMVDDQVYQVTEPSKTVEGLDSSSLHDYQVRSNNEDGSSDYGSSKSVYTAPEAPSEFKEEVSAVNATLGWNQVRGAQRYDVLFDDKTYNTSNQSMTVHNLEPGSSHTYQVRSNNMDGSGDYSPEQSLTTKPDLPSPPQEVKATPARNSIAISFSEVKNADSYDIMFDGEVHRLTGTYLMFIDLQEGTWHSYRVRANNISGSSNYSQPKSVQTIPDPPSMPVNVALRSGVDSVTLSWDPVKLAAGYEAVLNGTSYPVTDTFKIFSELQPASWYTAAVRAVNAGGRSDYSPAQSIRTLLSTPEEISAEATIDSVMVSWSRVAGATGYDIEFNGSTYRVPGTNQEFTGLEPDTDYTYSVRAVDSEGAGEYSRPALIRTLVAIPGIPGVSASSTLNSVTISWEAVKGAKGYDIAFDGGIFHMEAARGRSGSSMGETSKVFAGLRPNTEHSYRVRANGERGSSEYSPHMVITTQIGKKNRLPKIKRKKTWPDGQVPYLGLDPVNPLTGAFLWSYTWLANYGRDSLDFTAMYDSRREESTGDLGTKWTHSLNYRLCMDSEYAYFITPYDEVIPFRIMDDEGGVFLPVEGFPSDYTMGRKNELFYTIRDMDGTEYLFDSLLRFKRILEDDVVIWQLRSDETGRILEIQGRSRVCLTLQYSGAHIVSAADAEGNTVTFAYEGDYLVSAVNPEGNSMFFTYDEFGNLLEITDFAGKRQLTNQYDDRNRVVVQYTAGRGYTRASYQEAERITVFTDELGNETAYHYDENYQVTAVELAGTGIQNKYNELGQLTEQSDALGNATKMAYDEYGRVSHVTYADGSSEQLYYNEKHYPVRIVNRDGSERSCEYDESGRLSALTDERGNTGHYTYDEAGNLTAYQDKLGNVWTYTYDKHSLLEKAKDPIGQTSYYAYDNAGRVISCASPAGKPMVCYYSPAGDVSRIVDNDGTVTLQYDENCSCTTVTDRMGNQRRLEYDGAGQVTLATDFRGNEYQYSYDERGQLVREADPLGHIQTYAYDALGNRTEWTDPNGNKTVYSFNAASRLTQFRDAAGGTVQYTYDPMGRVTAVTDPLQHRTSYSYDAMGRVTSVTNALGHSISRTYDKAGSLLTEADEDGTVTAYAYDAENRLQSIQNAAGTTTFTYDKTGRLLSVQDTGGHEETAQYDGDGNVTEYVDKEGGRTTYTYNDSGRISRETDPNGGITLYEYDKNGCLTKRTDAEGNPYEYEYDADSRLVKEINPLGHAVAYEYDAAGNLQSVTDVTGRGGKTVLAYDGNGNLTSETNPLGGVIRYTYDSRNLLTEMVDEEGHKQNYAYDAGGNRISYTDANRNQWAYAYDALGRLTGITAQDGGEVALAYTKTGRLSEVTDQEAAKTTYRYDSLGRLTEMSDALENRLSWTYDSLGRAVSQTDACGNRTEYTYSPSGNLLSVKDPEGNITVYTYDALGQLITETDAAGNMTSYTYDKLGKVISAVNPAGGRVSFAYTQTGEIASVTDANGGVTHYEYDACGNLTRVTDAMGGVAEYEYDAMNNQIRECLSSSKEQTCITIYRYDKSGRMIRKINPLSEEKSYTYDGNGNLTTIVEEEGTRTQVRYDWNNRPAGMICGSGSEALYRYNKRGELVELKDWNGTASMEYTRTGRLSKVTDHNGRITGYTYDANGQVTGITYPDGSTVRHTYDKNGRITAVTDAEGQVTGYDYDPAGRVRSVTQPGSTLTYDYHPIGLPSRVSCLLADGTGLENNLTYDGAGNILSSERTGSTPLLCGRSDYTYDLLGRLTSCREGEISRTYAYDALGNRTEKTVNGLAEAVSSYDADNRLTGKTEHGIPYRYAYDKRGNLTQEWRGESLIREYAYHASGLLSTGWNFESGEKTEYGYNGLNVRTKTVRMLENRPGGYVSCAGAGAGGRLPDTYFTRETEYVTDYLSPVNNELIAYEKDFGAYRTIYGPGGERLSQMSVPKALPLTPRESIAHSTIGKSHFQSDLYGSVLFAANSRGESLRCAGRDAFGSLQIPLPEDLNAAGVENSLRYTNYEYDPVIGKHFAQARFYDAENGRMLSKDPVKRGLNPYPYCNSNPVNYVDPTGEVATILGGLLIGGVSGGLFGFAGSALSQLKSGRGFDAKQAWGAAANGAVVGAVRGALAGTGAGLMVSLAGNFAAGAAGSALEQGITSGRAGLRESVTGGLTNAVSGAIYGTGPIRSAGAAFGKGALAGAATGAINSLSGSFNPRGNLKNELSGMGMGSKSSTSPYAKHRNPASGCESPNPFDGNLGFSEVYGYRYEAPEGSENRQGGFDFGDFAFDVLAGAAMGGLWSTAFYGSGKAVEKVRDSFRSGGGKGRSSNSGKRLYRVMSEGELNAVKETGVLRGGREGTTYFTDSSLKMQ